MIAFVYDATFEGLLSAVFDAYTTRIFPDVLLTPGETAPLTVVQTHSVVTGREKADRVFTGLGKRMSREGKNTILLAFLSEEENISTLLFRYIRKLFDRPPGSEGDFTDSDILAVDALAKKVHAEQHLLLGFARFQKTAEGVYAALLGPRYNVLSLLVPHFHKRFSHPWILYDVPRGFGFYHAEGKIRDITINAEFLHGNALAEGLLAPGEKRLEDMWREYFATAAIPQRQNPSLQTRCLPRRFRPYMTETRESEKGGQKFCP